MQAQIEASPTSSTAYRAAVLGIVVIPFIATLYAIYQLWMTYVTPLDVVLMFSLYVLTGVGITIGFHRLLTHRSFETRPFIRAFFLVLGSMAAEGPAISWASQHIQHHANSDHEDDPHSPVEGLWHSHVGWLFKDKLVDTQKYGAWLLKDPLVVFISKTFLVWVALGLLIPFAIGGWSGLLWGGLVRMFITHHVTWSVNSVCHTFGRRMFHTRDRSYNNWVVGLLAFGEGWHNNHHAFPRAAFHGMRWWQVDLSAYIIRGLAAVGLVWNVWQPSRELLEKWAVKKSDQVTLVPAEVEGDLA
jgi:stearoyl-CoA desaturase (delta-9 desaturase)